MCVPADAPTLPRGKQAGLAAARDHGREHIFGPSGESAPAGAANPPQLAELSLTAKECCETAHINAFLAGGFLVPE